LIDKGRRLAGYLVMLADKVNKGDDRYCWSKVLRLSESLSISLVSWRTRSTIPEHAGRFDSKFSAITLDAPSLGRGGTPPCLSRTIW